MSTRTNTDKSKGGRQTALLFIPNASMEHQPRLFLVRNDATNDGGRLIIAHDINEVVSELQANDEYLWCRNNMFVTQMRDSQGADGIQLRALLSDGELSRLHLSIVEMA
jgi:hypothetical protein